MIATESISGAVHEIALAVGSEGLTIILVSVSSMVAFIVVVLLVPKVSYYIQRFIKW